MATISTYLSRIQQRNNGELKASEVFRRSAEALLLVDILLGVAHILWPQVTWQQGQVFLFNFASTLTIASWLAAMKFVAIFLLALIGYVRAERQDTPKHRFNWIWLVLAVGALLASMLEMTRFHERVGLLGYPGPDTSQYLIVLSVSLVLLAVVGRFLFNKLSDSSEYQILGILWPVLWAISLIVTQLANSADSERHIVVSYIIGMTYLFGGTLLLMVLGRIVFTSSSERQPNLRAAQWSYFKFLRVLMGIAITFGALHLLLGNFTIARRRWFELDTERNFPTWFSGAVLFLFGLSAIVAFYWELKINRQKGVTVFRRPALWLIIALAGFALSLDDIAIFHEYILWVPGQTAIYRDGPIWSRYITQWQFLLAPIILIIFAWFALFFANRFPISRRAQVAAFAGIGVWVFAFAIESIRQTFLQLGPGWYSSEVLVEEVLEMGGAILLQAAVGYYVLDIALDLNSQRQEQLQRITRFLTRRALTYIVTISLILIGIGGMAIVVARIQAQSNELPPAISADEIWFADALASAPIDDIDGLVLADFVMTSLFQPDSVGDVVPAIMRLDASPRIVFLSIGDGISPATVLRASGLGIGQAISDVLDQANALLEAGYQPQSIKFDIAQEITLESREYTRGAVYLNYDRSIFGLAFDRESGLAFLPEELVARVLLDNELEIEFGNMRSYLDRFSLPTGQVNRVRNSSELKMYHFTTLSYYSDGQSLTPLYRGHRSVGQPATDELLSAAVSAGQYLVEAVGPDGKFTYAYWPKSNTVPDAYNILRHAGTTYSMLELYEITGDQTLLEAADSAIDYLLASARPCQVGSETYLCIVEDGEVKLGGNALASIALAKYIEITDNREYLSQLLELGAWIQAVQGESGQFLVHKLSYPEQEVLTFKSRFYPGEALLALLRIYALDGDEAWLETAENSARYLITERDGSLSTSELGHDQWLLYGLNELHRYRPDSQYLDHTTRLAEAIIQSQIHAPSYPDWLGSYAQPPSSTPTATRSEGLYAAYQLIRDFGAGGTTSDILDAMQLGIAFQLQTQFRPESVMYLDDPQRALGGFHNSFTNYEIRIDYVQHNISSVLGLYRIKTFSDGLVSRDLRLSHYPAEGDFDLRFHPHPPSGHLPPGRGKVG